MSDNTTDSTQLDGLADEAGKSANDKAKSKPKPAKARPKPAAETTIGSQAKAEVFANSGFNRRRVWPD